MAEYNYFHLTLTRNTADILQQGNEISRGLPQRHDAGAVGAHLNLSTMSVALDIKENCLS